MSLSRRRRIAAKLTRLGVLATIFQGMAGVPLASPALAAESAGAPSIYTVEIRGAINPGTHGLLVHAIQAASAHDAAALIVFLDTPGGLLSTTRDMVGAIAASAVPVVGYVGPAGARAGSAGAFILLATHVAAMNVETNVGASAPIEVDGSDIKGVLGIKVLNDTRAFMRSIAQRQGKNSDVAERFVSEALSLTAREAADQNVVDLVVDDFPALLAALDGRRIRLQEKEHVLRVTGADVVAVAPRPMDRLLLFIAEPTMAHMLLSLGAMAIFAEVLAPGLIAPGIFGFIAVILGMMGLHSLPVETGFMILLLLGMGLMAAEFFVAGFGVLGIGGAIAFVVGSLNLFSEPLPAGDQQSILLLSLAVGGGMVTAVFLMTGNALLRRRTRKMKGKIGEAMVAFEGEGWVLVEEKRWPALSLKPLQHGDQVRVVEVVGKGRLVVEKLKEGTAHPELKPDRLPA